MLLYPNNDTKIPENVEKLINEVPMEKQLPRKFAGGKKTIRKNIDDETREIEKNKTLKILEQVELVLRVNRQLADQEEPFISGNVKHKRLASNKKQL